MRQIVLDTETTGLEPELGHRVIEIGAVELINRKLTGTRFHKYIHPERDINDGALEVHGITLEFLSDKPKFAEISGQFLDFIHGAELIIHNAPFDVSFLNEELARLPGKVVMLESLCNIVDSLALARQKHPGQKNSLDALCRRYHIDNSQRELHGALLDAEILADVYLLMTGGQGGLFGATAQQLEQESGSRHQLKIPASELPELPVIHASSEELKAHHDCLDLLDRNCRTGAIWRQITAADNAQQETQ